METTTVSKLATNDKHATKLRAVWVGALILLAYSMLIYDVTGNIPFGAAADILSGLAVIGIAVLMFPLFRAKNSASPHTTGNNIMNYAYLISKWGEGLLMIVAGFCVLSPSTRDYRSLIYGNIHVYFFITGALLFYYLLFRTRLVPRFLSVWGLGATVVLLLVTGLKLAGIESVILDALLMPMIGNEVILAIWLMVKGFTK